MFWHRQTRPGRRLSHALAGSWVREPPLLLVVKNVELKHKQPMVGLCDVGDVRWAATEERSNDEQSIDVLGRRKRSEVVGLPANASDNDLRLIRENEMQESWEIVVVQKDR